MSDESPLFSKVLILDHSTEHFERIKQFCDENGLIGLKVCFSHVMPVLGSNIDLGAILLAEKYCDSMGDTIALAVQIHNARPELPIMLRTESEDFQQLPDKLRRIFCATYTIEDMAPLRKAIGECIFSLFYPNALVRGIAEISINALSYQFPKFQIATETPYIVKDRIIFGEVFSLIPLESSWCRGYMMLQTEEEALLRLLEEEDIWKPVGIVGDDGLWIPETAVTFRTVNNILGELTNLIWGAFKSRFIADDDPGSSSTVQVPIVINHQHRYISFGSENPHLRFVYTLTDENGGNALTFYQWFVFNLNWSPENLKEVQASIDDLVESGEVEFF